MTKKTQQQKAQHFLEMHHGAPFILPNVWDGASARLAQESGFKAIGTASAAIAWSLGKGDGEFISRDQMIQAIGTIVSACDVPVTADIEKGYGETLEELAETIRLVLGAGAVGINIEDSRQDANTSEKSLAAQEDMCARIKTAREVAQQKNIPLVINARSDCFYIGMQEQAGFEETLSRAKAYLAAGADCIFVVMPPIARLAELTGQIDGPVNILALSADIPPLAECAKAGVTRVSLGPGLMRACYSHLNHTMSSLNQTGSFDFLDKTMSFAEMNGLFMPNK